jgi:uncharacterized protein (TIGR03067 family)
VTRIFFWQAPFDRLRCGAIAASPPQRRDDRHDPTLSKETSMTARTLSVTGAGLAVLVLVVSAPGSARADDMGKMQGAWKVTGGKVGGNPLPKGMEVTVEKDKFVLKEPGKTEEVHFVLDTTAKTKGVEFFRMTKNKKEKVWHGIYKIDGDKITFCWGPAGKSRPQEFEPRKDSEDRLYILEKK